MTFTTLNILGHIRRCFDAEGLLSSAWPSIPETPLVNSYSIYLSGVPRPKDTTYNHQNLHEIPTGGQRGLFGSLRGRTCMTAATVVLAVERDAQSASVTTFPNALWRAIGTAATVSYGDVVPVTAVGR